MKITQGYGQRVRATRLSTGTSMLAFAKRSLSKGASAKNIGRIEKEQVIPRMDTLERISSVADVDLNWLATGKTAILDTHVVKAPGIGQRVEMLRQARGLSMRALARSAKLGTSAKNVGRIEIGEVRPRGATVGRLANALGVSAEHLAFGA